MDDDGLIAGLAGGDDADLRSRRGPAAVLALAVCAAALRAVAHWQLTSGGGLTQQTPMIIEGAAAVLIAVTTHGPFRGAWICAVLVFAVGLGAFTLRGARTRPPGDG